MTEPKLGWLATRLAFSLLPVPSTGRMPRDLLALLVGSIALIAVHWAGRWYPRDYYAAPLVVVATAAILTGVDRVASAQGGPLLFGLFAAFVTALAGRSVLVWLRHRNERIARWAEAEFKQGPVTVAAVDAYVAPQVVVASDCGVMTPPPSVTVQATGTF